MNQDLRIFNTNPVMRVSKTAAIPMYKTKVNKVISTYFWLPVRQFSGRNCKKIT
jgi:hypothetical protein